MADLKQNNDLSNILSVSFKQNIRQYTMVFALLVIWIIFSVLKPVFLTPMNLSNLFLQSTTIAILTIGMTLVLVAGHLDLSVGSVAGFLGAIAAVLQVKLNFGTVPTIIMVIIIGAAIGCIHGYFVAYQKIPAFIVTLASMIAFRGAILGVTGGQTLGPMKDSFKAIGQNYLPQMFFKFSDKVDLSTGIVKEKNAFMSIFGGTQIDSFLPSFNDLSLIFAAVCIVLYVMFELNKRRTRIKYGFKVLPIKLQVIKIFFMSVVIVAFFSIMILEKGIPYAILLVLGLTAIFSFISNNTPFGRHLYAIGGNQEAAKLSGINIKQRLMMLFVTMGVMTAIAGIFFTARLNAATTSAGQNFELDAIAAAIIGGTSTMGGVGTIAGSLIGALVMASLDNGMSLMNLDIAFQYIIKGVILLLAVWVDVATRNKS